MRVNYKLVSVGAALHCLRDYHTYYRLNIIEKAFIKENGGVLKELATLLLAGQEK